MSIAGINIIMPAKSKKQQRLFGMVHACQKYGKCASKQVKKIADEIDEKDAEKFAKTSHNNLPEKKKEEHLFGFKNWFNQINENRNRTGLKFGYPDGYYRSQYPGSYSVPISATAVLDLEIEEMAPMGKETKNGVPNIIRKPKGMITFPECVSFKTWCENKQNVKGEKMTNNDCKCECGPCKSGDCQACNCKDCKCDGCKCC